MDWQVWKWLDTGAVEFRVHAVSRPAPIPNPVIRIGFHVLRGWERRLFLESTKQRMLRFTELALARENPESTLQDAAGDLTARPAGDSDAAHDALASNAQGRR
jgi:hypothetical protein